MLLREIKTFIKIEVKLKKKRKRSHLSTIIHVKTQRNKYNNEKYGL